MCYNDFMSNNKNTFGIFSGMKILLVEDMAFFQQIVRAMVEPTHLDVDCVANGSEAVTIFKQYPNEYSLILMNIEMPEMDGYEATRLIRDFNHPLAKSIPIIAFTGHHYDDVIEQCLEAGMNAHIGRPISEADFIKELSKYLLPEDE
jgi:CheY-like chemotaxis protein